MPFHPLARSLCLLAGVALLACCSTKPPEPVVIPPSIPMVEAPRPQPPADLLQAVQPPLPLPRPMGAAPDAPLTPDELSEGYTNLANHDRAVSTLVARWQKWFADTMGM